MYPRFLKYLSQKKFKSPRMAPEKYGVYGSVFHKHISSCFSSLQINYHTLTSHKKVQYCTCTLKLDIIIRFLRIWYLSKMTHMSH